MNSMGGGHLANRLRDDDSLLSAITGHKQPIIQQERPLPRSMAAIGDSITQGVGADPTTAAPASHLSWATGFHPPDPVKSHYERLLAAGAPIEGQAKNLGLAGSNMSDAPRQAAEAVASRAEYVTIMMGSNDLCVWSKKWITPHAKFECDFRLTMETLSTGLPDAGIFVLSIPDLYRVWFMLHDNPTVTDEWGWIRPCRSMFARFNTERDRQRVRDINRTFNETLERVSAEYPNSRFDGHAIFDRAYIASEVGSDFFHPSMRGHKAISEISWQTGFWPDR